jgi:hypothetical protein
MLTQTEQTTSMNLSLDDEAKLILADIFDGDNAAQEAALSEMSISTSEEILDNEEALYDRYLPAQEEA